MHICSFTHIVKLQYAITKAPKKQFDFNAFHAILYLVMSFIRQPNIKMLNFFWVVPRSDLTQFHICIDLITSLRIMCILNEPFARKSRNRDIKTALILSTGVRMSQLFTWCGKRKRLNWTEFHAEKSRFVLCEGKKK